MNFQGLADLLRVARRFQELEEPVVLVGGYAVFLLVDDRHRMTLRTTDDVDFVVKAKTYAEYSSLSERLRQLGFSECTDEGAPICRWVVDGIRVDVMPCDEAALGFCNRWYPLALQDPLTVELEPGLAISVVSPLVYLATKFEALANRGDVNDPIRNTDLEDIVTVIAFGKDVLPELANIDEALRAYLQIQATQLLSMKRIDELVSACLPGEEQSQARVPRVIDAFRVVSAGSVITLSQEHMELLCRPGLVSGQGGHQNYFRTLMRQRSGNRQAISQEQVQQAKKRLNALRSTGTWQGAYSAILHYFPEYRP